MAKRGRKPNSEAGRKPLNINDYPDVIPNSTLPVKDFFNRQEVANYLEISISTVDRWCSHGILKSFDKGGNVFITRESILSCRFK